MLKKVTILLVVLLSILFATLFWSYQQVLAFIEQPVRLEQSQLLEVKSGTTARRLLNQLSEQELISNIKWARFVNRVAPDLMDIKTGTYWVEKEVTVRELLELVGAGQEHQFSITFVEGSRFSEWLTLLKTKEGLEHTIGDQSEAEIATELGIEREKLEGLFLPETYAYTAGTTDLAILKRAHKALNDVLESAWSEKMESLPLANQYEALTLASIIEKETAIHGERRRISSVFVNRLNRRMRLQTDPTVIYGMGEAYTGNIRKSDLRRPTPYNTYTIFGLPPTPIAMAGEASIRAAVNPETSKYLYFVASGDGGHTFSKSLVEHNRAVRVYLNKLRNQ
ncbi:endolytic transglycosylase MltG [Aliivibrio kagoshimensis]|uniref:endolytic transglycosylase MltG n=1 Tax=Aliivibrio kagoshimensis TaxID=2910230 RepID=UPI003D0F69FE